MKELVPILKSFIHFHTVLVLKYVCTCKYLNTCKYFEVYLSPFNLTHAIKVNKVNPTQVYIEGSLEPASKKNNRNLKPYLSKVIQTQMIV